MNEFYFENNQEPALLKEWEQKVEEFVNIQLKNDKRVVLVTVWKSGGTAVPLESQPVRFLDNFSAGTRGSTSTEYFIKFGYSVIFLYRQYSFLPYSRSYYYGKDDFFDYFEETQDSNGKNDSGFKTVSRCKLNIYFSFILFLKAKLNNKLLMVPFFTITEYLFYLRMIAINFRPLSKNAVFYLAAAVSDFFIPPERINDHKIHSEFPEKRLVIEFDPVPKFLAGLVEKWAPHANIVSFKLETDTNLLISRARASLQRYRHRLVIGNLLMKRKYEVVFVTDTEESWIRLSQAESDEGIEIESKIVSRIVKLHNFWIQL
ncbi:phosphopantothenate--cysteine ligase CAB2 [Pneumocystis jirovecii RU7]|uniref:DNA/pantothenate metabolism flavoprotein C-terminal domain-containing protein n=1 Tax=Pneumocystis jirovecii (strain RU7) TaxID=1408657 RepID=A0A0W4ZSD6_PNEJ7|nr:phosphopantothenate--cysteine ligase CAB2 [Pneumocystis jirovecii RU7]KTW31293.1 hypothetical protein T551_01365 [Pneumocystis jirovecii RU7]